MPNKIENRTFDLREWQKEAYRKIISYANSGKKDFLCVATPGAGKTKLALTVAHSLLKANFCQRIVIVTPTEGLKKQWALEAAEFAGIDIDPDFTNSQEQETYDFHGIVITYAMLGQDKKLVNKKAVDSRKTFVIFDEIHHAGDNLTWGNAIRKAFENANFRLAISGTAFRSDDNPIPFITYNENNISVADYTYSYERAIKENVCRPVYFCSFNGKMKWKVEAQEFEHSFEDYLTPDQQSRRLRTALDPKGQWIRDVIKAADNKLNDIRREHHNAAGLIFASTQKDAKEIAKVVEQLTNKKPAIVISDDPVASDILDEFKHNNDKWIVSVKMVSEGVDIPRLRVGVYLTIIKAELFFRQAVGRFVRVLKDLSAQDAFIFLPQDKDMIKLAENIQIEREHALDEAERKSNNSFSSSGDAGFDLFGNPYYKPALKGRFVPLESLATNQKTISVNVEINSGARHTIDSRKPLEQNPVFMQKEILRSKLNTLAKKIALKRNNGSKTKPDWELAHKLWIKERSGRKMELETIEELKKRLLFYEFLLRN